MQDRAVFGGVDVHACEHVVAVLFEICFTREREEELDGLGVDAVFGVVDVQITDVDGELAPTGGVVGEQLPEMAFGEDRLVSLQRLPGLSSGDVLAAARDVGAHEPTLGLRGVARTR
ncbi:Uncharacterised protein [Mycobacteroides abscessus subsp. abscessus]|nr:Uncharacterised protein [Mycobacteroides abscessus subsp. abscessus]